jgi:SAM-dependent methyltransferase
MTAACRSCGATLDRCFIDLGASPLSNAFLSSESLGEPETHHPLKVFVCDRCFLVQLPQHARPDAIFDEGYAYFSSYSETWLQHAAEYARTMSEQLELGPQNLVIEVASNDGYLLQYFADLEIPVLGIEPAANTAEAARERGVPTRVEFFGTQLARDLAAEGCVADLLVANNVLAHVPDIHDFLEGFAILLEPGGVATFEFPHVLRLIEEAQFDTIYHEHYSYLSLIVVERLLAEHRLLVHDVEQLGTHGGSLRVHASHTAAQRPVSSTVAVVRELERQAHLHEPRGYAGFAARAESIKLDLLEFLVRARRDGKKVAGYGAPAKGNTLLNFCGVRADLLPFTTDRSPHKQGLFLPGSRIPVLAPEAIYDAKPDYVLILPWNLKEEIVAQLAGIREWGGQFIVSSPRLELL